MSSIGSAPGARSGGAPQQEARQRDRSALGIVAALPEEVVEIVARLDASRGSATPSKPEGLSLFRRGTLAGCPVTIGVTGDGRAHAESGIRRFLETADVERLLIVGVAGGLSPGLDFGDVVVAERVIGPGGESLTPSRAIADALRNAGIAAVGTVVTVPTLLTTPASKREAAASRVPHASGDRGAEASAPGVAVADLESYHLALHAEARGLEWGVIRTVSDRLDDPLPSFLAACTDEGGSVHRGRVAKHLLLHPGELPGILRLRDGVRRCATILADAVQQIAEAPHASEVVP
ncbi:MAG: hypothetical protein RQ745_01145 [Longimicrobiales bacterium]|nr:hypothetical protein [Longimicrobiales bacterium]